MGTSYNPKIVTDGLILNLDAANRKSYSGSGANWVDLSKNKFNGTLVNSPQFSSNNSGYFSFLPSSSQYATSSNFSYVGNTISTCVWIYRNASLSAYTGIVYSRLSTQYYGIHTHGSNANNLSYTWTGTTSYTWDSGIIIPLQSWTHVSLVINSTNAYYYINGVLTASNTLAHGSASLTAIDIGQDNQGSRFFNGNIASCQIYNRALTSTEVLQNFNATKGRFGL
jgi:Concanavalin A-like lectin/glucanases superfamily